MGGERLGYLLPWLPNVFQWPHGLSVSQLCPSGRDTEKWEWLLMFLALGHHTRLATLNLLKDPLGGCSSTCQVEDAISF